MTQGKDTCEELWIGRDKSGRAVRLNPEGMLRHHIVIGQSGSGKSFMLGRLIEEMVLHTHAKLVLLDLNADFSRLDAVNEKVWNGAENPKLFNNLLSKQYDLDKSAGDFATRWQDELGDFLSISAFPPEKSNLKISWNVLTEPELRQLLGLIPTEHPEATWLLGLLARQANREKWTFEQWQRLGSFIVPWSRGHFPRTDERSQAFFGRLQRYISLTVSPPVAQQVATALGDAFDYAIWNGSHEATCFDTIFEQVHCGTHRFPRVICVNLASLGKESARLFVARYVLDRLWRAVSEDRWSVIGQEEDNGRRPVFVVVDEVHRLAPQQAQEAAESGVLEVMRQIAAEGRKQGLFFIVATQRPSKLHSDILSECDNVCVMRSVGGSDIKLLEERLSFKEPDKLEEAKEFDRGQAIFSGQWTDGRTVLVHQIATRRTVESGGDLPHGNFVRYKCT